MRLSDLITPTTPAGAALFLQWNGYHVFSIPKKRVIILATMRSFFGVGGKRQNPEESFTDCALRESAEEIGNVVSHLDSAEQTYLLKADGTVEPINLIDEPIRPQLILEKRNHSGHGSMTNPNIAYYLVAFNATLLAKPKPSSEIAAILYLKDFHLSLIKSRGSLASVELIQAGAKLEYQAGLTIEKTTILVPHGTVHFLIQQQNSSSNKKVKS